MLLGHADSPHDEEPVEEAGRKRGRPKGACKPGAAGSSSATSDSAGKAKRGHAKGQVACRGCAAKFDPSTLTTDSAYCLPCKRLLDCLSRLAAKEGDEAVVALKQARNDPKRIRPILKQFVAKVGDAPPKRGKVLTSEPE